jgi:hypothetical protein
VKGRHEQRFADFVGDHGEVLAFSIPGGEATGDPVFSGANALRLFVPDMNAI